MDWRLIEEEAHNAQMNMAIDDAIISSVSNKKSIPTIRFYRWVRNSVSISAYQDESEINIDFCTKNGMELVRRMTGGGAVFHGVSDFTYSLAAPIQIFRGSIRNAYSEICRWIIKALNDIGINAMLKNKNDIVAENKKISGNAAKKIGNVYFQHGTLAYCIDCKLMINSLNMPKKLAKENATCVSDCINISREEVYKKLKSNFIQNKKINTDRISGHEMLRATDLAKNKYYRIGLENTTVRKKGICFVRA